MIRIAAFSHDADLFIRGSEAAGRQLLYCRRLRLSQVVLVRSKRGERSMRLAGNLQILSCPARHWSLFPITALWRALIDVRGRCHLVTAQDAVLSALPAAIAAALWRRPLVIGVFSDEIDNPAMARERPFYRLLNGLAKALLGRAAAIRTDSGEMAVKLARLGYPAVHFVPFLIPGQEGFLTVRRSPGRAGELRVLMIVRLEEQKNVPMALAAVAELSRSRDVRLDVVGDGSRRTALMEMAAGLGLADRVRFHGARPYSSLPGYFADADVLLLTSHHETAARVLTLAALSGVPAVTTATTGAAEVVEDGRTGFIVPIGDLAALTERLGRFISDPDLSLRLGEAARSSAVGRFGAARVLAGLARLYRSAA